MSFSGSAAGAGRAEVEAAVRTLAARARDLWEQLANHSPAIGFRADGSITVARSDIYGGRIVPFVPFTKLEGDAIKGTHNN